MRILILLAIALLLYIIISNLVKKMRAEERAKAVTSEQMVRCEHCGLHILEQEALKEGREYFCSQEHIEAHKNQE
jgi:uncharacterized protein